MQDRYGLHPGSDYPGVETVIGQSSGEQAAREQEPSSGGSRGLGVDTGGSGTFKPSLDGQMGEGASKGWGSAFQGGRGQRA